MYLRQEESSHSARFYRFSQGLRLPRRLTRCALNNSALILVKLKKTQASGCVRLEEPSDGGAILEIKNRRVEEFRN